MGARCNARPRARTTPPRRPLASLRAHPPARTDLFQRRRGREPLYACAPRRSHRGPERDAVVHRFDLLPREGPMAAPRLFECGSGTYVRSLVRDPARRWARGPMSPACAAALVDPFSQPRMFTLKHLREIAQGEGRARRLPAPIEAGLSGFPRARRPLRKAASFRPAPTMNARRAKTGWSSIRSAALLGLAQREGARHSARPLGGGCARSRTAGKCLRPDGQPLSVVTPVPAGFFAARRPSVFP
jgi:tRNA pseudouridine55 synthase